MVVAERVQLKMRGVGLTVAFNPPHLLGESPAKDPRAPELGPQYTNDLRLLLALLLQKAPDDRPTASDALAPGPPPGEGIVVGIIGG